ncbi:unnamed protein product [Hymenolepis diminuta]|uniref:Uncharacterized protein n=1 Tax=Hymenolepis diminuta TaxID=6216 RepID=A0A564ZCC7_HYMDI|nr:unnamed protein product [Hymenolepis diminuta]
MIFRMCQNNKLQRVQQPLAELTLPPFSLGESPKTILIPPHPIVSGIIHLEAITCVAIFKHGPINETK